MIEEFLKSEKKAIDNELAEYFSYLNNDEMRCYYCKTELFTIAGQEAEKRGLKWIMYGYNASDIADIRPGHQAALEKGVLHPLAELNFSKDDIRTILKSEGIEIAEKADAKAGTVDVPCVIGDRF